jgi:hypothetical protein
VYDAEGSLKYQWLMKQHGLERIAASMDLPVLEIKYVAEKRILDKIVT